MRFLGLNKLMKKIVKAVLIAAGFLTVASSASAQGAVGQNQPPDQWVMNCNTERGRDCTVSAMIDGGPNNLLGTFLIVSYSVAYTTLTVVADGLGQRASIQVDTWPYVSTTICTGGECSYEQGRSNDLVQEMLRGSQITVQLSTSDDGMVGPLTNTLSGFAAQYQRAVEAQRR
jgi:invasion protein IalB